ncbi:MAG TPA: hypothetical protein VHO06_19220 [Polyangia bacterium]|nr:hypothetical protein [Polyangia bacterium]
MRLLVQRGRDDDHDRFSRDHESVGRKRDRLGLEQRGGLRVSSVSRRDVVPTV